MSDAAPPCDDRSAATRRPRRRDAQQRRDALIEAAAACFGEAGYAVALEDVADRAGVGRGTLYRNFKDRMALILAIFERQVDRLDTAADPQVPLRETMVRLVREGMPAMSLFTRLRTEMPLDGEHVAAFRALGERLERLVEPAAAAARERGEIRPGVGGHDLVLALRMAGGLVHPNMTQEDIDAEIGEAIDLLMRGFR